LVEDQQGRQEIEVSSDTTGAKLPYVSNERGQLIIVEDMKIDMGMDIDMNMNMNMGIDEEFYCENQYLTGDTENIHTTACQETKLVDQNHTVASCSNSIPDSGLIIVQLPEDMAAEAEGNVEDEGDNYQTVIEVKSHQSDGEGSLRPSKSAALTTANEKALARRAKKPDSSRLRRKIKGPPPVGQSLLRHNRVVLAGLVNRGKWLDQLYRT